MTREQGEYNDHITKGYNFVLSYRDVITGEPLVSDESTLTVLNGYYSKVETQVYFQSGKNIENGARLNHIIATMAYNAFQNQEGET